MHTLFRLRNAAAWRVRALLLVGVGAWLLAGLLPSESVAQDTGGPPRDAGAARADSAARDSILPLATGYEQLRARYRSFQPVDSAAAARAAGGAPVLALDGLVIDETRTRLGRTFYRIFYQRWEAPEGAAGFTVAVRERPSPGRGTVVSVHVNGQAAFRVRLQPRTAFIERAAQAAVRYAARRLQRATAGEGGL